MNYSVIVTPEFERRAKKICKKYPSFKNDLLQLNRRLQYEPITGESIGKDCYKIRIAITGKNKGKSGGARIITYILYVSHKVYLLSVYDKSEQSTILDEEINKILQANGLL